MTANDSKFNPAAAPTFQLQRVFLKGVSLEMPQAPEIFIQQGELRLNFQADVSARELEPGVFCVNLRGTLTAELEKKVVYLLEIEQAGIFEVRNIPSDVLPQLLEIQAPSILTSYLRANLSDVLTRATLPMFFLPEIDWATIRAERAAAVPASQLKH